MNKFIAISMMTLASVLSFSASAYDGTNCKEPGVCWEPKPGFPAQVAGSKYDPKHDVNELNKQAQSIKEMEARNEKRWKHLIETGKFVYEIEEN
ncbi:MAG: methanol dehydrogenase [cytochrome c] subunit [Methylomicrobium sp.]|nr:methanol dehydrogenase [cytochrome c] subunit [Methylomicrobium sp.]